MKQENPQIFLADFDPVQNPLNIGGLAVRFLSALVPGIGG
jgi:hypothetical protein